MYYILTLGAACCGQLNLSVMLLQLIHMHIQEGSGFIAVNTTKLIVYGSYSSTMSPSVCVEAVERLGKKLNSENS